MKTTKWILTILVIFIVSIGIATEKPKMNIVPLQDKKAIVLALNADPAFFEITIENRRGDIMYYKRSENPLTTYRKVFDFSKLEDGSYAIKLKVNDTSLAQNFSVTGKKVVPGDSHIHYDPYFSLKNDLLKFSYLNFEKENVKIKIYSTSDMIYEKKLGNEFSITDGVDLSKLKKGKYEVTLHSFNHKFKHTFEK